MNRKIKTTNCRGLLVLFILACGLCAGLAQAPPDRLVGYWLGELDAGGAKLHMALQVKAASDGTLQAKMISLDQDNAEIPVKQVSRQADKVSVDMPMIQGGFDGVLNAAGDEIAGEFRQGPAKLPLTLKRTAPPTTVNRPQEPKKPYPYGEEELTVENASAGLKLAGTLTIPPGPGPFPAVLLITGSGTQDRNETIFEHHPFLVLADFLTRRGLVVLRLDDRGCGGSGGDPRTATSADFATDILAGVRFLSGRPEVNKNRIGLIGHSEGGMIAPMLAADHPTEIAFIVLMAGPGVTGEKILYRQSEQINQAAGAKSEEAALNRRVQEGLFAIAKSESDPATARKKAQEVLEKAMAETPEKFAGLTPEQRRKFIDQQIGAVLLPWIKYFLVYDPAPVLARVKCPVLALNGEKDLQVDVDENLPAIAAALKKGGNPDVTTVKLPGLNHLFQACKTGLVDEYGTIEETLNPRFLETLGAWLDRKVK